MPEGKKAAVPAPKPVREEDLYSAKTHLHQPVPVQETATVSATAQLADAPEGALPSEVRPEIVTWEKLCEAIKASGRSYNMEMIEKAYDLANTAHKGVCRRSGEPYICHPLAVARLVLDLGMDSESIAAALLHDVGKPQCQTQGERDGKPNMHYYGHPEKSLQLVKREIVPTLEWNGEFLSETEKKRLFYYVAFHDDHVSFRKKHLRRHLKIASFEEFQKLMILQTADAKAHIQVPVIDERVQI